MSRQPQQGLSRPWWLLPIGRLSPWWWTGLAALMLWIEYVTGPTIQFPVAYMIPVSLAAWYSGRRPALALAIAMPLAHIWFLIVLWKEPLTPTLMALTAARGTVIIAVAL